mgnify:CR=1 FL=1|jgi:hypothetical protein
MDFMGHYATVMHLYSTASNIITERVSEALNIPRLEGIQKKARQSITSAVRNPSLDEELAHLVLTKQRPNIIERSSWWRHIHIADDQALQHLSLHTADTVHPPPTPRLLLSCVVLPFFCFGPVRVGVGRNDDNCEFGVGEDRSAVVEQVICSELDSGADNPPERPEVMVDGVGDHEGIIW